MGIWNKLGHIIAACKPCNCPPTGGSGSGPYALGILVSGCTYQYYTDPNGPVKADGTTLFCDGLYGGGTGPFGNPPYPPVYGATVTYYQGTTAVATGTTDATGHFTWNLPNGTYTADISAPGYLPKTVGPVTNPTQFGQVVLTSDTLMVRVHTTRCDFDGTNVPWIDGSGTTVTASTGPSATTDVHGCADFTFNPRPAQGSILNFTLSGPGPYYGAVTLDPWTVTGICALDFPVVSIPPQAPLNLGYVCALVVTTSEDISPVKASQLLESGGHVLLESVKYQLLESQVAGYYLYPKPLPSILHCTIGGVAADLSNGGSGAAWIGCATIKGTTVRLQFTPANIPANGPITYPSLMVQFLSLDWGNASNNGDVWRNGWCYPATGPGYQPVCPNPFCNPGDHAGHPPGEVYNVLSGSALCDWQPGQPGFHPYVGTGSFDASGNHASFSGAGGAVAGCPWAGPFIVAE